MGFPETEKYLIYHQQGSFGFPRKEVPFPLTEGLIADAPPFLRSNSATVSVSGQISIPRGHLVSFVLVDLNLLQTFFKPDCFVMFSLGVTCFSQGSEQHGEALFVSNGGFFPYDHGLSEV